MIEQQQRQDRSRAVTRSLAANHSRMVSREIAATARFSAWTMNGLAWPATASPKRP